MKHVNFRFQIETWRSFKKCSQSDLIRGKNTTFISFSIKQNDFFTIYLNNAFYILYIILEERKKLLQFKKSVANLFAWAWRAILRDDSPNAHIVKNKNTNCVLLSFITSHRISKEYRRKRLLWIFWNIWSFLGSIEPQVPSKFAKDPY